MNRFVGKTILVTGAASGIGRATAIELARQGGDLIVTDIDAAGLQETAAEIQSLGCRCLFIVGDITNERDVSILASRAVEEMGQVDILFNNAGTMFFGEACDTTIEHWKKIVNLNVWGPILLTRALLPHMIERGSGQIVTTASIAGLVGVPGGVPYSTTKFAAVGFSEALRAEVRRYGIDVSVVCPGPVKSGIVENGLASSEAARRGLAESFMVANAYPADKAAREIVRGIEKRKGYIVFPLSASLLWSLKRVSPEVLTRLLSLTWGLLQGHLNLKQPVIRT